MIRKSSEAGQLISEAEILRRLAELGFLKPPAAHPAEELQGILREVFGRNEDLHLLSAGDESRHYYSSRFMTRAYALVLLQKRGDPLHLIASVVRENSALYPRPVPLDLFTQPPFGLSRQEILTDLERMAAGDEYRDIMPATTSTSRVYLYSTLHLEHGHASMLAEWLDVGQFENP
ncbi:MAG: hypothetical protein ACM3N7_11300 [Planctomycetaceae bacterium]